MKLHNIHPCSKLLMGSKLNSPTSRCCCLFLSWERGKRKTARHPPPGDHVPLPPRPLVPLLGHQVLSREGLETYPVHHNDNAPHDILPLRLKQPTSRSKTLVFKSSIMWAPGTSMFPLFIVSLELAVALSGIRLIFWEAVVWKGGCLRNLDVSHAA